jgi:signal transduction histidine kinase
LRNLLDISKGRLGFVTEECDSEHLAVVVSTLDRMERLLDDLLALARQGEAAIEPEAVTLARAVEQSWDTTKTADATLVVDTDRVVRADESQLRQLLSNLFRNAIEHGGKAVTVTVGSLEDGFYVADDGSGIPPEKREYVFDAGYTTARDGTGFGLLIVERVAQAHGWSVAVTDSRDGGARFEFTDVESP